MHEKNLMDIERRNIAMVDSLNLLNDSVVNNLRAEVGSVSLSLNQLERTKQELERRMQEIQADGGDGGGGSPMGQVRGSC
jgi:hypothetical protein